MNKVCSHEWTIKGINGYPWCVCRKCGVMRQYTPNEKGWKAAPGCEKDKVK